MKEETTISGRLLQLIRKGMSALVVTGLVVVVPVFSMVEYGHFFHTTDSRSAAALPAMTVRPVDKTALPPQLFQEPLITVTFDDGFESIYNAAMPLLQKYGIHTTQYILGGTESNSAYVSWKQIAQMQKAGHEIACHTMTHPDLTTLDPGMLNYQLSQCKQELSQRFGPIDDFASPYGAENSTTLAAISKYFDSQRNTNGDPSNGVTDADVNTAANFDRFDIIGVTVRHDTTVQQLQALVDYAKQHNGWVVLTYHQADQDTSSPYEVDSSNLDHQLAYLSSTNVRIVTISEALSAVRLQGAEY